MAWTGEISPATVAQIKKGRGGRVHIIEADAGGVAEALKKLDSRLCLRYSEAGQFYVVYAREPHEQEGQGYLVGTFQECDMRIVKHLEKELWEQRQPGYNLGEELNKKDDEAEKKADAEFSEQFGDTAEKLAWALRKDFNMKGRMFVPKEIPSGGS